MSVIILLSSIISLLLLIAYFKLNPFIALSLTAIEVGFAKGMAPAAIVKSMTDGIGSTMGGLILVLGFGVMLGAVLAETGAAQQIAGTMIRIAGVKRAKLALALTGFIVGIAMFYNAGFVVLAPLVFVIAQRTGLPLVYLGVAMASALSITHGFLPPHPGPTTIAVMFKADIGKTLLLGIILAIPATIIAGLIFPEYLKKIVADPPKGLLQVNNLPESQLPSFGLSLLIAVLPVLLMAASTIGQLNLPPDSSTLSYLKFLGDPSIAMLLALLLALFILGSNYTPNTETDSKLNFRTRTALLLERCTPALNAAAMIFLITAAGGSFKQVLSDSGIGQEIAQIVLKGNINPLLLGWLVATVVRIAIGSATVAGQTAAGIMLPVLVASPGVSPELMVLSIGAGSLMCSHVNDTGFWMFKEYFGLSLKDTFRSWTLMETIIGIVGLIGVMGLEWVL